MTAAEFESGDVLLFLVQYLKELIENEEKSEEIVIFINQILHQTSRYFKQDLIAIVMNNESLGLSQQIIVLLEATIHHWKAHEFQG